MQNLCNVLLDSVERLERAERNDREMRLAFMASGKFDDPADLFEEFQKVIDDDEADIEEGTDLQGNAVSTKWDFSHAALNKTQAEVEREVAQMLAAAAEGSASFEMPTYGDWI